MASVLLMLTGVPLVARRERPERRSTMVRLQDCRFDCFDCLATIARLQADPIGPEADRRLAPRIPREIEVRE